MNVMAAKLAVTEYDGQHIYPARYAHRQFKRLCAGLGIDFDDAKERLAIMIEGSGYSYIEAMIETLVNLEKDNQLKICLRDPRFRRKVYDLGNEVLVRRRYANKWKRIYGRGKATGTRESGIQVRKVR